MKKAILGIFLVLFFSLFAIPFVYADVGPHTAATLKFFIKYNNQSITENFNAEILACSQGACTHRDNFDDCEQGVCSFYYYTIERVPRQMKLLINLNGEYFSSDIINFSWTKSPLFYDINIMPDDKVIITPSAEQGNLDRIIYLWLPFVGAFLLTIAIEMIVAIIFLKKWKIKSAKWRKPLLTVAIADIISVPLVWVIILFIVAMLVAFLNLWSLLVAVVIAEAFAVVFEAYALFIFNKKILPLKRAFWLSFTMNLASFVLGDIILTALLSRI